VAGVEFSEDAAKVLRDLPRDVAERYAVAILAVGADPYGQGKAIAEDPDERAADLGDGWLLYRVRPGQEPGVYLKDIGRPSAV
jgi:hypothetical protein